MLRIATLSEKLPGGIAPVVDFSVCGVKNGRDAALAEPEYSWHGIDALRPSTQNVTLATSRLELVHVIRIGVCATCRTALNGSAHADELAPTSYGFAYLQRVAQRRRGS